MRGDFSRFIFDRDKHYSQTLMQQGRVQLDTDWNEQIAIRRYHHENTASDVIGLSGAPKIGGGFAIALAGANNLSISPGRIYADGLLIENRAQAPVLLTDQPFLKQQSGGLTGFNMPTVTGRYAVYLEAWERTVTGLQDPRLLDPALGGADTTVRLQVAWQVRLTQDPLAAGATCGTLGPGWFPPEAAGGGTLTADTDPGQASTNPCVLPASAGYRGLENRLYRVEIHQGGPRASARWKWSAFNGSIETTVGVSGQVLTARDLGRDEVTSFAPGQWIELVDERMELSQRHGQLLQIQSINPDDREITIAAATPVPAVDSTGPVRIRRWDNPTGASAAGLPMDSTPAHLEAGVVVSFGNASYRTGDYWTIPARTALNGAGGHLDWPRSGGSAAALPPEGVVRHFVPLAIVDFNAAGGVFTIVGDGDCRQLFPPLTAIAASDVSFIPTACNMQNVDNVQAAIDSLCRSINGGVCTFTVRPESDLQAVVDRLADGSDGVFCFGVGAYDLRQTVIVRNKGNVVFTGGGSGTAVSARESETVFRFERCTSATVRNLSARSGRAGSAAPVETHLSGTLTFLDCGSVIVDNVNVRCAAGTSRGASCIAVRNAAAESDALRAANTPPARAAALVAEQIAAANSRETIIRIQRCRMDAGDSQVGILLSNPGIAFVTENVIRVVSRTRDFTETLADSTRRSGLRRSLISNLRVTNNANAVPGANASLAVGPFFVHFQTDPALVNAWSTLATRIPPPQVLIEGQASAYIESLADQALGHRRTIASSNFLVFEPIVRRLRDSDPAIASQGILIGGRSAEDIRIADNVIDGVLQGIHIGLSHPAPQRSTPDEAGVIQISRNTVGTRTGSSAVRARHGIFVGSCRSLQIDDNELAISRPAGNSQPAEGIRIFGNVGRRMVVRDNHLRGYNLGVFAAPFVVPQDQRRQNLWLITNNIAESASTVVGVSKAVADAETRKGSQIVRRPDNFA